MSAEKIISYKLKANFMPKINCKNSMERYLSFLISDKNGEIFGDLN